MVFHKSKREQTPLFEPTKDLNLQYGTQNNNNILQTRINTTQCRKNELPFEKIIVGPAINKGYDANLEDFIQMSRDYVLPKTDELRPKVKSSNII